MSFIATLSPSFIRNKQDEALRYQTQDLPGPDFFEGDYADTALNAVTRGTVAEPAVLSSLAAATVPMAIDKLTGTELTDTWMKFAVDPAIQFRDSLKINPKTNGTALQILDSLGSLIPQAVLTGPVGTGVLSGISETAGQISDGMPLDVSTKLGFTTGVSNALGVGLPAAVGSTLVQRLATGMAGNAGLGAMDRKARHDILADAGFQQQADHYQWNDSKGLLIDSVLGAAFGGLAHLTGGVADSRTTGEKLLGGLSEFTLPSHVDAALTANEARHVEDLAPGIPTTAEANNAHVDTLYSALDAVSRGEPVRGAVDNAQFIEHTPARLQSHALSDEFSQASKQADAEQFALRTGRKAESEPLYADGSAHLLPRVLDFYNKHVAHLKPKGGDPMPNVLFRIGEVSDSVAAGLHQFLPGFHETLREARISAQAIKHIHDSRPDIAPSVLQRLEQGVLSADEVLPNPKNPERALLVLKDIPTSSHKKKHGVTVIEVSANGRGIDIATSMTVPDKYLKEARELSKSKDLFGGAAVPSSSLSVDLHQQHHPAADFPKLKQALDSSIHETDLKTMLDNQVEQARQQEADSPDMAAARQIIDQQDDFTLPFEDDAGNPIEISARQLLADMDNETGFINTIEDGAKAAITCFMRHGDL